MDYKDLADFFHFTSINNNLLLIFDNKNVIL